MTPGATLSIGRDLLLTIGSPPSTASPSAFTTLPSNASPTGTSTILPVRFTSSPSRIKVSWPSNTAPIWSSSKFSTIPITPCGNSKSSEDIALSMPWTMAIPSPTLIT